MFEFVTRGLENRIEKRFEKLSLDLWKIRGICGAQQVMIAQLFCAIPEDGRAPMLRTLKKILADGAAGKDQKPSEKTYHDAVHFCFMQLVEMMDTHFRTAPK